MKKKRYFIFYYVARGTAEEVSVGYLNITSCDGVMPSQKRLAEVAKEENPSLVSLVVTGYNEMNKKDYESFNS